MTDRVSWKSQLVPYRMLHVVDDEDVTQALLRFELEPKLFLESREDRYMLPV